MGRALAGRRSPGAIKALIEMNSLVDVRPLLGAVRVPTLVVHRGTDYDVKVDEGRYVAERIPGARFVELPGADHFVAVDSDQILDVVEPFLVECGAAHLSVHEESRSVTTLLSLAVARNHATAGRELLPQHVEAVRVELARFRGRAVRGSGDDLVATFDGPARAVRCAAASVRALQLLGVTVRAGVHTGEVEVLGDRVRGVAVQIAAHIAQEAAPGEVLVSRTVKDLVAGAGLVFTDRGSRAFAGAPGEWQVLAVAGTNAEADDVPVAATAATVASERAVVDRGDREDEMLKLVTVLFADMVDSTALAETRHPEDVRDLMADYFAAMTAEIEAEGGTIEKFIGDAIMAVFGVPSVREDDAVRAVRAAWRMRERLRSWSEARGSDQPLEIRIGLSTGEVLSSGAAGGNLHVTGDSVNVAARLQQAAEPGTIVLADRTARAVRSRFALRAIEPLALKGRSEALAAWLVERGEGVGQPAEGPGIATPIVGRDNELALLRTSFDHVGLERRPALVTVVGDAGVGKSRLVRELLSSLEAEAKVLIGRCLSYGQGVTLWPLAEMLKAEAGVHETDRSDDAFRKIVRFVGERVEADDAGDPARVAAALASTLGLRPPGDPLGSLDPRELYRELVGAWLVLLAAMGSRGPVVAVVEDLHWADSTLLDVLDELAERVAGPIFFLCTARPDLLRTRPDWGGGRRTFSSLPLDPLSGEESARLVSFLPGVDEWPDAVRRLILERAGGNPFFLEEIVRHLIDEGLLVWEDERWRARSGIERAKIPDNIHAVILARLDLLSPDERRVAQRAAVVGRVFWDGALARLSPAEDLEAALRTLRRREFVVERLSSTIPGQTEYVFKHVLLRDVAYASLPRAERGRAHAETAAWMEETSGERTGELAELLAHHYDAAFSFLGDDRFRRSARAYLLTGAANAHRRFAIQQGDRLARRAVELSEGAAERVESLEALGDLQYLAFLGDAAWRTYGEALAELSDDDPAFPRLAGKATLFATRFLGTMHELPDVERVRHIVEQGLLATPAHGPERTLLLVNRGFLVVQREGRHDDGADAAVREAAAAAEELDDADLLSAALDLVATHEENAGRYGDAYRTDLRRNGLVARMTDVKEIGDSYAVAARAAHFVGRFREAESHASAGIERARGIDSGSYLHALTWRVSARFALGEWESALADQEELERVAPLSPRALPPAYAMGAYTRIALCHELRGEREEADRYIELALRYFEQVRHARQGGSIHIPPLALTLARRGRFDEALAPIPYMPRSTSASTTLEVLCEIAAMRERWDEAAGLVSAARDEAVVGEQLSLPPFADRLEGRAAHAEGDLAAATELLARSAEGFAAIDARWDEAWSRLLLAEVVAGSDGRRAEQQLAAALPVFERLGSVGEIERARALRVEVAASG